MSFWRKMFTAILKLRCKHKHKSTVMSTHYNLEDENQIVIAYYRQNSSQFLARLKDKRGDGPHLVQVLGEEEFDTMYAKALHKIRDLKFADGEDIERQWRSFLHFCHSDESDEYGKFPKVGDMRMVLTSVENHPEIPRPLFEILKQTGMNLTEFPWAKELKDKTDTVVDQLYQLRQNEEWKKVTDDLLWLGVLVNAINIVDIEMNPERTKELSMSRIVYSLAEKALLALFSDKNIKFTGNTDSGQAKKPDLRAMYGRFSFVYGEDKWQEHHWKDHPDLRRLLKFMYNELVTFFNDFICQEIYTIGLLNSGQRCTLFIMRGERDDQGVFKTTLFEPVEGWYFSDGGIATILAFIDIFGSHAIESYPNSLKPNNFGNKIDKLTIPEATGSSRKSSSSSSSKSKKRREKQEYGALKHPNLSGKTKKHGKTLVQVTDDSCGPMLYKYYCSEFEHEFLPTLSHPNIIKCFCGSTLSSGCRIVVMEDWPDGNVTWSTLLSFSQQLLKALDYLHDKAGIIHRDVKRSNIRFANNCLKLIDFGLACRIDEPSEKVPLKSFFFDKQRLYLN
eukprot:gb/GECH01010353.1/.p1 GENE.gb/GECH01010353.1/~~gb/GECH01010353.1/.p1  ORF type:complete len:562 (+),score=46.04 gb/GECH01010353.1/:1-1686(+)